MIIENWRFVIGYKGRYMVSDRGRILRVDGKNYGKSRARYGSLMPDGYMTATLRRTGFQKCCSVHRLVAQAFLPNPHNLTEVNHIDNNRSNNRVENLEWCNRSHNVRHAALKGKRNSSLVLNAAQVRIIKRCLELGMVQTQIGGFFGVGRGAIKSILKGKTWSYIQSELPLYMASEQETKSALF